MIVFIIIAGIFWGVFFIGFITHTVIQYLDHKKSFSPKRGILDDFPEKSNQKK
jgi:hypothetical protein